MDQIACGRGFTTAGLGRGRSVLWRYLCAAVGDERAFDRVNPLTLLRTRHYVGSSGAVVVGVSDVDSREDAKRVAEAAKSAGMDSHLFELPGAHDWWLFSVALDLRVDEDQVWVSLTNTAPTPAVRCSPSTLVTVVTGRRRRCRTAPNQPRCLPREPEWSGAIRFSRLG